MKFIDLLILDFIILFSYVYDGFELNLEITQGNFTKVYIGIIR